MANTPVVVLDDTLTDIANAIRGKNGSSNTYKPGQMADAIDDIPVGTLGIPREVSATGVYWYPAQDFTFSLPPNATDMGKDALSYALQNCTSLTSVDLNSLTTVSGANAFSYAFQGCSNLTSVDVSSLVAISANNVFYYTFRNCSKLTSVNFSSLATISGGDVFYHTFQYCSRLTSVSFPALTPSSFGTSHTSQFRDMLIDVTGCTVHFPAATQAKIETMTGYPNFGGTNTTVLFDL